jgi:hypothetical protein
MSASDSYRKNERPGRRKGATSDPERGLRLIEESENLFGKTKKGQRLAIIGVSAASWHGYTRGANIDNKTLAALLRHGADIGYILTGERSSDQGAPECPRGLLCERLPKLLQLLGEMFEGAAADPEQREALIEAFRTAAAAIQDRKRGGQTG